MKEQLTKVKKAYDLTVKQFREGIDPLSVVPEEFKNSMEFKALCEHTKPPITHTSAPENKAFLNPQKGMKFLDAGCSASLFNYRLDKWPCKYYGVDISTELIMAMKHFVAQENIDVGGLEVAEITSLPYEEHFFDIASVIGVFEYVDLDYAESALSELHRVLKHKARMVVDIPNLDHPLIETMFKLEEYLNRPNIPKKRSEFERILVPMFKIIKSDDTRIMLKYFVNAVK